MNKLDSRRVHIKHVLANNRIELTPSFMAVEAEENKGLSDNLLLEAVAQGKRGAFALLMKRYVANMVMLAQRIVFDREQAREIVQEAFLRVWQNAAKWDPHGSATFLTWLRVIVVNLSISARRRHREQVSIDFVDDFPSAMDDGFDDIVAAEQKKAVHDALQRLSERQRAAIALYYFDELAQAEAAEVMQMTPRAFVSLIVRARTNLKDHLVQSGVHNQKDLTK